MKVIANDGLLSAQFKKLKSLYTSCINCRKQLDQKRIAKIQSRCKKCEREYAKIWPTDPVEFYSMFKGQT